MKTLRDDMSVWRVGVAVLVVVAATAFAQSPAPNTDWPTYGSNALK